MNDELGVPFALENITYYVHPGRAELPELDFLMGVLEASGGGDALLICEQYPLPIHVMLSDVVMPRMSGREVWERLSPMRPNMKILFMSGYTDDGIVHHGVLSSEFAFVQKPLMPSQLLAQLRLVIDKGRVG